MIDLSFIGEDGLLEAYGTKKPLNDTYGQKNRHGLDVTRTDNAGRAYTEDENYEHYKFTKNNDKRYRKNSSVYHMNEDGSLEKQSFRRNTLKDRTKNIVGNDRKERETGSRGGTGDLFTTTRGRSFGSHSVAKTVNGKDVTGRRPAYGVKW